MNTIRLDEFDLTTQKAIKWLLRESKTVEYGEITLSITLHAGQVRGVDRTIKEKEQKEQKG